MTRIKDAIEEVKNTQPVEDAKSFLNFPVQVYLEDDKSLILKDGSNSIRIASSKQAKKVSDAILKAIKYM